MLIEKRRKYSVVNLSKVQYNFSVSPTSIEFSNESDRQFFIVTSNRVDEDEIVDVNYSFNSTEDWITITKGTGGIRVSVTDNTRYSARNGTIKLIQQESRKVIFIPITQLGLVPFYTFNVTPSNHSFTKTGGSFTFDITSTFGDDLVSYDVHSKPDWCTVSDNVVQVGYNSSGVFRNGIIEWIQRDSGLLISVNVDQTNESIYVFNIQPTSYNYINGGGVNTFRVTSTVDGYFTQYIITNKPSWTTSEETDTSILLTASSNYNENGSNPRSSDLVIQQPLSGDTITIPISQDGNPAETFYTYRVNSNCEGGSVYFDNVYRGSISDGSMSARIANGASSYRVTISGGTPDSYSYRICGYGSLSSSSFSVGKSGGATNNATLNNYTEGYYYDYYAPGAGTVSRGGSVTLNYTSSQYAGGDYQQSTPSASGVPSWASFEYVTNLDSESWTIGFYCNNNSTGSSRSANITINSGCDSRGSSVTLTQSG